MISEGLKRVEKGKFNPPKTGGARVENGLEPPKGAQPFNPPRLGRSDEPRVSDRLIAAFGVKPERIWVERAGRTVRGVRPAWLDWPSHTAAEMAREPWRPSVPRETKRQLA